LILFSSNRPGGNLAAAKPPRHGVDRDPDPRQLRSPKYLDIQHLGFLLSLSQPNLAREKVLWNEPQSTLLVATLNRSGGGLIGAFQPRNVATGNTAAEGAVAVLEDFVP